MKKCREQVSFPVPGICSRSRAFPAGDSSLFRCGQRQNFFACTEECRTPSLLQVIPGYALPSESINASRICKQRKRMRRYERGRPLAFGRRSDVWDVDIDGLRRSNPVYCPKSHVTKWQAVQDRTVHTHRHSGKYNTKF